VGEETLDLRRSVQLLRRHLLIVILAAAAGLAGGVAYAVLQPPLLTSTALVRVAAPQSGAAASSPPSATDSSASPSTTVDTLVVIASSDPVLRLALPQLQPHISVQTLQRELQVKSLTPGIISIRAEGSTAAQATATANAVAGSFVAYIASPQSLNDATRALVLQPAATVTGRSRAVVIAIFAMIGILAGAGVAAIGVLAASRRDRRLRLRDEIADSIGIPVLASVAVGHPSSPAGWGKLLTGYQPAAVDAWRLRGALNFLRAGDLGQASAGQAEGVSLAVLSLRSDPGALALGPQLAAFAAALDIRTHLVIDLHQDPGAAATLRAACTGIGQAGQLQVSIRGQGGSPRRPAALTIVVAVIDQQPPPAAATTSATLAVLGVSAGKATAQELAQAAIGAADQGCKLVGILVADPDPADHTTGRLPQPGRAAARTGPTRLTGIPTETRPWMTTIRQP
jgi:capsular polysaccharide biosynthesis protein